jgi:hypothetical protein
MAVYMSSLGKGLGLGGEPACVGFAQRWAEKIGRVGGVGCNGLVSRTLQKPFILFQFQKKKHESGVKGFILNIYK